MSIDTGILILIITLLVGCYALIIAHMKYTSGQLAAMYAALNTHIQRVDIHPNETRFVKKDVCELARKTYESNADKIDGKLDQQSAILTEIRDRLTRLEN